MSVTEIEQFLTLHDFKTQLDIDDNQDDSTLIQYVDNSNKKVHTTIFPYTDGETITGTIYFSRCHDAALAYARSLHAESIELLEKSKHYLEKYDYEMYGKDGEHGLIEELKKTPTSKQKPIFVDRTDFESDRKIPFSQIGYGGDPDFLL